MTYKPTVSETESYLRDGYLVLNRPIFATEKFNRLKAHMGRIFAGAAVPGREPPATIECPHWTEPAVFEWLFADEMLDMVEPLIGPNIAVFACHLLQKPARAGKGVPWHADSVYWSALLDPVEVASVTIALTPASADNGCLRVISGSHLQGAGDDEMNYAKVQNPGEQIFEYEIMPPQMDETKVVNIELLPNQASIHDGRIIHGSALNHGATGRNCLTVRYFPTHVKFKRDALPGEFHVFLARGVDQAGNEYSDPHAVDRKATAISTA